MEAEEKPEELKMADGTMVQTEGRVQFVLKCDGYRKKNFCPGFPQYKQMIHGLGGLVGMLE